jgi:hypothetical protein
MIRVRKLFIAIAGIAMAAVTLSVAAPTSSSAAADPAATATQFFTLLNATRAGLGHAQLQRDPKLDALALEWSGHMADVYDITKQVRTAGLASSSCDAVSALCHRPSLGAAASGIDPAWRSVGENVGTGGAVEALNDAFNASAGHFANIVGNYNRLGVGVVVRNERIWVTFNFLLGPELPAAPAPTEPTGAQKVTVPAGSAVLPVGGRSYYQAVDPKRVVDTRSGLGGPGPVNQNTTFTVSLKGIAGQPAGALGAALNVTATGANADGYLTVYPCGSPVPVASNVNFSAGQSVPNLVAAPFGTDGKVCIFTSAKTDLLVDVAGWLSSQKTDSSLKTVAPTRLLDSRSTGVRSRYFAVSLASTAPADATAATVNVTVTDPQGDGYVTAYPCGSPVPDASNVNFAAGQSVPNLAVVRIGTSRSLCFFSSVATHLIVDSAGWFGSKGGSLNPVIPNRILDTRSSAGGWSGRLGKGQTIDVNVGTLKGMDPTATGAVMNVTAISETESGYVTIFPCGGAVPTASNLNFGPGKPIANLVTLDLPADGRMCVYASERVNIIADLAAYISA